jgi:Ribbon-helix-helix protein, copG family
MRTTIYLPDDLLTQVKKLAAESRTSVTALIEDALKERLARRKLSPKSKGVNLTTYGAGGLLPGIDLDDTSALLDLMEPNLDPHRR